MLAVERAPPRRRPPPSPSRPQWCTRCPSDELDGHIHREQALRACGFSATTYMPV